MRRKFSAIGALACGALWLVACSDEDQIFDDRGLGGSGGRAGAGGRGGAAGTPGLGGNGGSSGNDGSSGAAGEAATGGTAGTGGAGGTGGSAGTAGGAGTAGTAGNAGDPDGGVDGGETDAGVLECVPDGGAAGCDDGDECTTDTCGGAGVCQTSIAASAPCATGFCTAAGACDCAVDRPTGAALPYNQQWLLVSPSVGGNSRDFLPSCTTGSNCAGDPDEVIVFTAPSAGTYRFGANGTDGTDPQIVVFDGNCTTAATQLGCNDDINGGNTDAQVDIDLSANQVVTVVASPSCEAEGGTGNITIELLP